MSIFQKMLVAPLAGVVLYSVYLAFIYDEQKASRQAIEEIRAVYLPLLELSGRNVLLFDAIASALKDAVLAGEIEWVQNTRRDKAQIDDNLARLQTYAPVVTTEEATRIQENFQRYYDNAHALAMILLGENSDTARINELIENVERYHGQAAADFDRLRAELLERFSQRIDDTQQRLRRQVLIAAALGVVLIVVIVGVTFVMSLSTRKALREVNLALRNMAQDKPDFSRRLTRASNDELGELVGWFNLLADKLESDHKQIELLSITDKLTQLYNRTKIDELFQLELNKVRRYGEALAVILIDLDHFKSVNDTYGHQAGDQVLRELAGILRSNLRDTDHVGRWGGEEFIVLAPNTDLEQASRLAEKLRAAIAGHAFTEVGGRTGSFGVASHHDGDDEDTLTKRADACLYVSKKQGRNQVVNETALPIGTI